MRDKGLLRARQPAMANSFSWLIVYESSTIALLRYNRAEKGTTQLECLVQDHLSAPLTGNPTHMPKRHLAQSYPQQVTWYPFRMPLMLAGSFHVTKIDDALVFQALKSCGFEGTGNKILREIKMQLQLRSCFTYEKNSSSKTQAYKTS